MVDFEQAGLKAALEAMGMIDWFAELKTAQDEFEQAFQNKASDSDKKDYKTLNETVPELIKHTNKLLNRIDSDAEFSDTPEQYTQLISTLNNILDEAAVVAKARQTRKGKEE